jgi:quercetin dioxygenase-like cupin family protein
MMTSRRIPAHRLAAPALLAVLAMAPWPANAHEQAKFVVEPVAEKALPALPGGGDLYWHMETFATLDEAEAAVTDAGVAAEVDGKAWLLTLAPEDAAGHGGEHVATIGPVDRFDAQEYLLRINVSAAPPGSKTSVHSHPGSEAIYILSGEATIRWPGRTEAVGTGEGLAGEAQHTPMEATSSGDEELVELIMFVVDSTQPFSSPAVLD